ncbi:hypothetical protein BIU90_12900 [Curtobacterium sp. MCBA15_001]|nr:hypothetical protein BIU90_12900 [Curtobacterium sp. MCBA15_001]
MLFGLYAVHVFHCQLSLLKYCLAPFGSFPFSGETAVSPLVTMLLNSLRSRMFLIPEPLATMFPRTTGTSFPSLMTVTFLLVPMIFGALVGLHCHFFCCFAQSAGVKLTPVRMPGTSAGDREQLYVKGSAELSEVVPLKE